MEKRLAPRSPGKLLSRQHPLYDAKAQEELAKRAARIRLLMKRTERDNWEEGDELSRVRDRKLYLQAQCNGVHEWAKVVLGRSSRTVSRRLALVDTFARRDVDEFGAERLLLLQQYVELTRAEDAEWAPRQVIVDVVRAGRVVGVPFPKCSLDDLTVAIVHQLELVEARKVGAIPAEDLIAIHALRALPATAGADRSVTRVSVDPDEGGEAGKAIVRISARLEDLPRLFAAVGPALRKY